MGKDGDPEQADKYKWIEVFFTHTSNPQILSNIPASGILESEVGERLEALRNLSTGIEFFLHSGGGLSQASREARENSLKAFTMHYIDKTPVKDIAEKLNCNVKSVYRYLAEIKFTLFHFEKICLDLRDRFVNDKDWQSLQVLHYILIGKETEEIIRISQQEPFSYMCTNADVMPLILMEIANAKVTHPPYIQWKKALSRSDIEEAYVKIRSISVAILAELKRNKKPKSKKDKN